MSILLLVNVQVPGKGKSLADYADWLAAWRIDPDPLRATHPSQTPIAYPYTESNPDPLGDALHKSPGLTLRPGDLVKIVKGQSAP